MLLRAVLVVDDSDWKETQQSAPYIKFCSHILPIGRLRWIAGSKHTGKDNYAWFKFDIRHDGATVMLPRTKSL